MQDATTNNSTEQPSSPSVEKIEKELEQLQASLDWYKTEYQKLVKLLIAQNKRSERHICAGATPWLPFENQQELEEARDEAEAEARVILDKHKETVT